MSEHKAWPAVEPPLDGRKHFARSTSPGWTVHLGAPILVVRSVLDQADERSVDEDDRLDLVAAHERGRDAKEIVQDAKSRLARDAERYAARADRPT